ncbi:Uncharacterised protein [Cedecea lapagei]|uniref:Fimbrial assembly protein (PilN) n=1 Tax=Cedecea lapagei TaxID=158823 RepID=A0A3S4JWB4_9ENTR|nr:PilN domain-containing protein [Cedecea lapagei]VEB95081.1 Uncharacterised protein [Cedecea lapagei]
MTPLINLLPWRTLRRRYRLKLWGGLGLSGMLLVALLMLLWTKPLVRQASLQEARASVLEAQQAALKSLLLRKQTELKENQQRLAVIRAEVARRIDLSRWESVLNALASQLPENSWLQSVSWQNGSATVAGVAGGARELGRLEAVLGALPGAFKLKPGELRDEKHKGLLFSFALIPLGGERAE